MIRLDPNLRQEAIEAGFVACPELAPIRDRYLEIVQDWNPVAVCDDEKVIGCLISKDDVIHLAIVPEYRGRWASRRIIADMLKYGKATDVGGRDDFVERIGFQKVGSKYKYVEASWRS